MYKRIDTSLNSKNSYEGMQDSKHRVKIDFVGKKRYL